jgi:hypothetical protein
MFVINSEQQIQLTLQLFVQLDLTAHLLHLLYQLITVRLVTFAQKAVVSQSLVKSVIIIPILVQVILLPAYFAQLVSTVAAEEPLSPKVPCFLVNLDTTALIFRQKNHVQQVTTVLKTPSIQLNAHWVITLLTRHKHPAQNVLKVIIAVIM